MRQLISAYLVSPRERRSATVAALRAQPAKALAALLAFRGPYPANVAGVDAFPDYLAPLLTELLRACPRLLLDRDLSRYSPGERWSLLAAAMAADLPGFTEIILAGLGDRSSAVRELVVQGIVRHPGLRRSGARVRLRKLLAQPAMAASRGSIRDALAALPPDPQ